MQLLQPQEVEVYYLLPAIRRGFSLALKERGMSQKDIASLLGVTQAAVSQYVHEKRAHTVIPKELKKQIDACAGSIVDKKTMIAATQKILAEAKKSKLICKLHAQHAEVPKKCDVCFQ